MFCILAKKKSEMISDLLSNPSYYLRPRGATLLPFFVVEPRRKKEKYRGHFLPFQIGTIQKVKFD